MFERILFLKNKDGKTLYFKDYDNLKLLNYNLKGYNIYRSVNTFFGGKRLAKNIGEIRACFVDIDYEEAKTIKTQNRIDFLNKKFQDEILPKIEEIEKLYNISPFEVNMTFKGFHLIYNYSPECYFLEINIHQRINDFLINEFLGDQNAKDIARVYKIPGFVDNMTDEKFTVIEYGDYKVNNRPITRDILENKFKEEFKERDLKKILNKVNIKERINSNISKLNEIDGIEFILKLQGFFKNEKSLFSTEKIEKIKNKLRFDDNLCFYEEDGINLTSGLKIINLDGINRIRDFSKKTRIGNYNFLKNWIVENDFKKQSVIIHSIFGIGINGKKEKSAQIDEKILYEFTANIGDYKDGFGKFFIGLFAFIFENITKTEEIKFENDILGYRINLQEFLNEIYSISGENQVLYNKRQIIKFFDSLNDFKISLNGEDKKIIEIQLLNGKGRGNKDFLIVRPLENKRFKFSQNFSFFNKDILSYTSSFSNSRIIDLFLKITAIICKTNHNFNINKNEVFCILNLNGNYTSKINTIRKHLQSRIKKGFFKSFKITENIISVSRYKDI